VNAFALGYGTNGFANHRLHDALAVIADLGYTGVALTLDHAHLDPYSPTLGREVDRVRTRLGELGLRHLVIETGARYLLDPARKHSPTLLSDDPGPRVDFLDRALLIAADLGADCVSFWSGVPDRGLPDERAWTRLREGVATIVEHADRRGVRLGMEPEPGHLVRHVEQVLSLRDELGCPPALGVTLDVGHCVAVEPTDAAACVRRAGPLLFNVQLDDMLPGVHEHLEFGEGRLDLAGTLSALTSIGYQGLAAVELPRHSHAAPVVARRALAALRSALPAGIPARPVAGRHPWLDNAARRVRERPSVIGALFPAVGRKVGRAAVDPGGDPEGLVGGTVDDRARGVLLAALAETLGPADLSAELTALYRYGDDAERRGVLRGLTALVDAAPEVVEAGRDLVKDALRTNDIRLVAAAMGPFASRHLDRHSWRHGVLKCLFVGVPLAAVADLEATVDEELVRMIGDYAAERRAAGRDVPAGTLELLGKV